MSHVFGYHLRRLREAKGWSQKQLAEAASVPQPNVSAWEQGRKVPGWDNVLKLAEALGASCEEFNKPVPEGASPPPPGRPPKAK